MTVLYTLRLHAVYSQYFIETVISFYHSVAQGGSSSLHDAARIGHAPIISLLVDKGADINSVGKVS
jgi:ankyrin repeat protein